ncbi:hypothetical protein B0I37DRAFT_123282 [Chaetomium sp. MPI-CAGE-AT-0009]|nr:hypothetical protein B0I37DRAFT_123282 [Chaetomium sp. MPI-CAGE-AT-0009]
MGVTPARAESILGNGNRQERQTRRATDKCNNGRQERTLGESLAPGMTKMAEPHFILSFLIFSPQKYPISGGLTWFPTYGFLKHSHPERVMWGSRPGSVLIHGKTRMYSYAHPRSIVPGLTFCIPNLAETVLCYRGSQISDYKRGSVDVDDASRNTRTSVLHRGGGQTRAYYPEPSGLLAPDLESRPSDPPLFFGSSEPVSTVDRPSSGPAQMATLAAYPGRRRDDS